MPKIVYLVRHAAPPADKIGRYWGRADPGLDPEDLRKTASLAPLFREKPMRLVSSPLHRAVATAVQLAPVLGLDIETDAELAEIDFGRFDGMTWTEVETKFPDAARAWSREGDAFAFPGGESVLDFLGRAAHAWKRICEIDVPAVLVVSHGGVIAAWTTLFLGLPPAKRFQFPAVHRALSVFERFGDGAWNLTGFNNRSDP